MPTTGQAARKKCKERELLTLGAEKHLETHLDKLLEVGGGIKVTPLVGFRLLSHPLSHLGV
jgi:hypothetical protein